MDKNMNIAGTIIEETQGLKGSTFLSHIFTVTSGITLGQVREITGLESSALQNWIKRGWVSGPINKRYNIDQVARILLINTMRDCLQLEKIAYVMRYINGDANSRLDDIIPESHLYIYFCTLNENYGKKLLDKNKIDTYIDSVCVDYIETITGGEKRLKKALKIIIYAYRCTLLKKETEELIAHIQAENPNNETD